jgi:ribosomal protein S3
VNNINWKLSYFEKSKNESHINIFKSLEIKNYLKQTLKNQGLQLHNYKLNFSNSTLNILLSLYQKEKKIHSLKKKVKSTKINKTNFFKNILKNLNRFTNNKFYIILTIQIINVGKERKNAEKTLLTFRKFNIPGIKRLYLPLITQKHSAELLGFFIAKQLEATKRHNFFLSSLKESLTLLLRQKSSKIKGAKILIKGRLNNAPRSRNLNINIGKIPIITKNISINYSESTAFTSNGTIGVKVWVNNNNQVKNKLISLDNKIEKSKKSI